MKKSSLFIAGAFFLLFSSCEEEPLPINFEKPQVVLKDTTYINSPVSAVQDKMVLLEDYTGVNCAPCPNGHQAVKDILTNNPGRVAAVAIHPGATEFPQASPIHGEPDFNTIWGAQILAIIGKPNGIPYGTADRLEKSIIPANWNTYVSSRLAVAPPVNIDLTMISFDETSREITYEVKVEVTGSLTDIIYFSTMITEDGIISKQKYDQGTYDPYTHNHVLRNMPNFGVALNPSSIPALDPGRVFIKQYKTTLSQDWKPENCRFVAFVHKGVEVLQTAEKHVK